MITRTLQAYTAVAALALLLCSTMTATGFTSRTTTTAAFHRHHHATTVLSAEDGATEPSRSTSRRALFQTLGVGLALSATTTILPQTAQAVYVMDEETGDYVEVAEDDWQTAWKQRLEKAQSLSKDEIFQAARGAGNLELKEGMTESEASKKRRAMSACRDDTVRSKAQADMSERDCTARVFGGEVEFMLDVL
jgi:hypothetical protein